MLVIDKIKTQLSSEISLQTKAGLFFSAFDHQGQLLASNGDAFAELLSWNIEKV